MNSKQPDEIVNRYAFGRFTVDVGQGILAFDGQLLHLAPKTFELLVYFLKRKNEVVDKNEIMEEVWRGLFVEEANLSVHVSHLRKILAADIGESASIETFPKKGYRFVIKARENIGETAHLHVEPPNAKPDIVPEQVPLRIPAELQEKASGNAKQFYFLGERSVIVGLVVFLAVIIVFAGFRYHRSSASETPQPISSVAVLPFVNDSEDPEMDYLSDGLTESVLRRLSLLPALTVKARATAFMYKGKVIDPQTIGREISVQAILLGRISKKGDTLALRYELVECATGNIIVTGEFRSDSGDVEKAENEIVQKVAGAIRPESAVANTGSPKRATQNREALVLYLKGRDYWNRRTVDDFRTSIGYFQRAIEADPDFALAYSGLADAYSLIATYGGMSPDDAQPRAKSAALKALSLDPELAEAHASLGQCLLDRGSQLSDAEFELKRAIELNPNYASAYQWYAETLSTEGRFDEARIEIRKASDLDPLSRIMRNIDGRISLFSGNYDEAISIFKKNIDLDPTWGGDYDLLFHAYEGKEMYKEAVTAYLEALKLDHRASESELTELSSGFGKDGWRGFVRTRLRQLDERSRKEFVRPMQFAEFYARMNKNDAAFLNLNQAIAKHPSAAAWIEYLPVYKELRSDPRYTELYSRFVH
ncbi:MAG: winged helix-turn-helix domain-containing protein [Acidobacteriota bacterium]